MVKYNYFVLVSLIILFVILKYFYQFHWVNYIPLIMFLGICSCSVYDSIWILYRAYTKKTFLGKVVDYTFELAGSAANNERTNCKITIDLITPHENVTSVYIEKLVFEKPIIGTTVSLLPNNKNPANMKIVDSNLLAGSIATIIIGTIAMVGITVAFFFWGGDG